jgi:murein DD-endopeptidase MepM/ murein hydrolase activator NlpD
MRRAAPALALIGCLLLAAPAGAASGGASPPSAGGGTKVGQAAPPAPLPKPAPLLRKFSVSGTRLRFRIDAPARLIRVRVVLKRLGSRRTARRIGLGAKRTRKTYVVRLRTSGLKPGRYVVALSARDRRGKALRRARRIPATRRLTVRKPKPRPRPKSTPAPRSGAFAFPLVGPFSYGGDGSRFGAGRPGHRHQGQDLAAPAGTPIVAPHSGVIRVVAYQASGAGHYIVLRSDGENRDYVFMHLATGSTRVSEGQRVRTGQRLGDVGSTGASSGPHLHFEVWVGGWYTGGKPIDPLPLLRSWD